jgi:PAS domain S-box-containing protein
LSAYDLAGFPLLIRCRTRPQACSHYDTAQRLLPGTAILRQCRPPRLYSLREAAGRDLVEVFNIVNETSRARHEDPVAKIKRLRAVVGLANHTVLLGKQGTEIPIDDSGAPIIDADGQMTGIILVFRDIRERKRAESALRAADRLAATGKLAASLAHEIHNPLANVGSLLYLMGRVELPPQVKDYLRQAADELKRITNLSHRMLSLNRESQSPVPVKIVDLLDSIIESLRWRIQQGTVDLKRHYEFQGEIAGFPGELRQVFFNLIMNALEAMDGRGTLEIRARSSPDPRYAVEVAIRDSGVGIPNSARPNVFESFFTTKGEKGTGLGLWIARNIVQKHNGSITFDTRTDGSDQGTEFTVTLLRKPAA